MPPVTLAHVQRFPGTHGRVASSASEVPPSASASVRSKIEPVVSVMYGRRPICISAKWKKVTGRVFEKVRPSSEIEIVPTPSTCTNQQPAL